MKAWRQVGEGAIVMPRVTQVVYAATERSVDYGRREEEWRPVEGYCFGKDAAAQGLRNPPPWDDEDITWQGAVRSAPSDGSAPLQRDSPRGSYIQPS